MGGCQALQNKHTVYVSLLLSSGIMRHSTTEATVLEFSTWALELHTFLEDRTHNTIFKSWWSVPFDGLGCISTKRLLQGDTQMKQITNNKLIDAVCAEVNFFTWLISWPKTITFTVYI